MKTTLKKIILKNSYSLKSDIPPSKIKKILKELEEPEWVHLAFME